MYYKISQFGGMASNPASGINNIMLQPNPGDNNNNQNNNGSAGNSSSGLSPDELTEVLNGFKSSDDSKKMGFIQPLQDLYNKSQDEQIKTQIKLIIDSIPMTNDMRKQTRDPDTGNIDPNSQKLVSELEDMIQQRKDTMNMKGSMNMNVYNHYVYSKTKNKSKTPAEQPVKKKRKKSKGNPFRVLMGKVGELMDKGYKTTQIIHIILKENIFDTEITEKAIDAVRDYRDKEKLQNLQKNKNSDTNANVKVFNFKKYAEKTGNPVYDAKPDYSKRSTSELLARSDWLKDLQKYNKSQKQGDARDAADKTGVASDLAAINKALRSRIFNYDGEI